MPGHSPPAGAAEAPAADTLGSLSKDPDAKAGQIPWLCPLYGFGAMGGQEGEGPVEGRREGASCSRGGWICEARVVLQSGGGGSAEQRGGHMAYSSKSHSLEKSR